MSNELKEALQALSTKLETKQNEKFQQIENEIRDLAQQQGAPHAWMPCKPQTMAQHFMKSDGFNAMKAGARDTGKVTLNMELKALTSLQGSAEVTPVGIDVQSQRMGGLFGVAFAPTRLSEALAAIPVASNALSFTRLINDTNAADYQNGEGTNKAEQDLTPSLVTANIATIAVWIPASEQVLDDEPGLAVAIDSLLRAKILDKVENELINGTGAAHKISGLLNEATTFAATATDKADKIGQAIATLQADGYSPSAICISPADWFEIRSERATGGEYVANGWLSTGERSIYDVPVVVCSKLATGTVIVMDTTYVNLLDRQAPTVMMSSEDGSNFIQNLVTIRAEMRVGLAVYDQQAVLKVSLV